MLRIMVRLAATCALGLAMSGLITRPLHAADPGPTSTPLCVTMIYTEAADAQAEALTKALRRTVRATPGWSLSDKDYSIETLALALKCPIPLTAGCESTIAKQIAEPRYIWGSVSVRGSTAHADLFLVHEGHPTKRTHLQYSANLTEGGDDALARVASQGLRDLVGGILVGTVEIASPESEGTILVDGKEAGTLQKGTLTLELSPGEHQVSLRGAKGEATTVMIRPGEVAKLTLAPATTTEPQEEPHSGRKTAAYASFGGAAIFAGLGIFSSIEVHSAATDSRFELYRDGFPPSQDACERADADAVASVAGAATPSEARSFCSKAHTFQILQLVFYPLAAVSAGVGVYLLATDSDSPSTSSVFVRPTVAGSKQGVEVGLRW